jgi:hypothetical protein
MHPVLGGKVVERERLVNVVGDLGHRLRELRTVGRLEGLDRVQRVAFVLGILYPR